jgi:hypothetical protein
VLAAICLVSARQALGRFLLGNGCLVLTWPCAGSNSSGGALFGRPTLLVLVDASESEFYTNKRKKNESEKHDLRKAWNDLMTRPLTSGVEARAARAQCFPENSILSRSSFRSGCILFLL